MNIFNRRNVNQQQPKKRVKVSHIILATVMAISSLLGNLVYLNQLTSAATSGPQSLGVTIGSYNVLTNRWGGFGFNTRSGKIARNIKDLNMDVVALQEYESGRGASRIISELGSDWEVLKDNGAGPAQRGFGLAYAWNTTKIKKIGEEPMVSVSAGAGCGGGSSGARIVHFQTSDGKDFYLGNHHGRITRSDSCSRARATNIKKIINKLDNLASSGTPAILAGDTNSWPSDANGGVYTTVDNLNWAVTDKTAKEKSGGTPKIDRIFYSTATVSAPTSFTRSSCTANSFGSGSCGSDHKPITATFGDTDKETAVPISIGTYNILGYYHGEGSKYAPNRLKQIVKNINSMQYDVVGLQEYKNQVSGDAKELEQQLQALNSSWKMAYFATKGDADQLNFVYNSSTLQLLEDRAIAAGDSKSGCDGGTIYVRIARFAVIASGQEFLIINVHPTSNHDADRCDTERLSVVKGALADSEVSSYLGPVLFVGDFNANPKGDRKNEKNVEEHLQSAGFGNARDIPGAVRESGGRIDHIYYKKSSIPDPSAYETMNCKAISEGDPTKYTPSTTCASDHVPVKAVFGVGGQGDCGPLSEAQKLQYPPWGVGHYGNECTCSEKATGGTMRGETNFEKIATYLAGKGLSATAIAGITGNWKVEAFPQLSPFIQQVNSAWPSGGYGEAQWTGSRRTNNDKTGVVDALQKDSRTEDFFAQYYDNKYGGSDAPETGIPEGIPTEVNDAWLQVQLDFMLEEFKQPQYNIGGGYTKLLKTAVTVKDDDNILTALNSAKSATDAALIFTAIFEKQGALSAIADGTKEQLLDTVAKRVSQAEEDILKIKTLVSGAGDTGCGGSSNDGATIDGDAAFPLITTKKAIGGADKLSEGHVSTANPYYYAVDIMIDEGTPIVAMQGGTVKDVQQNKRQDYNGIHYVSTITIVTDDGKYEYFYTHMGINSPKESGITKRGQAVKIGQQIGAVGNKDNAFGTPPHLHIDASPIPPGRLDSCSRLSCPGLTDKSFVKILPRLKELYEKLPE